MGACLVFSFSLQDIGEPSPVLGATVDNTPVGEGRLNGRHAEAAVPDGAE